MQREFNLELLANKKAVVNCKRKEEEQEFLTYLDSKNIKWITGSKIFNPTSYKYDRYKEETCFKIDRNNELSFDEIREFKDYTILSLDDIVVKKKLNNFKDYGFEADFEGEILKEVKEKNGIEYLGYFIGNNKTYYPCIWTKSGRTWKTSVSEKDRNLYNLKPIKKEWYENNQNVWKIISIDETLGIFKSYSKENETIIYISLVNNIEYIIHTSKCRPATQKEILSLLVKE